MAPMEKAATMGQKLVRLIDSGRRRVVEVEDLRLGLRVGVAHGQHDEAEGRPR